MMHVQCQTERADGVVLKWVLDPNQALHQYPLMRILKYLAFPMKRVRLNDCGRGIF